LFCRNHCLKKASFGGPKDRARWAGNCIVNCETPGFTVGSINYFFMEGIMKKLKLSLILILLVFGCKSAPQEPAKEEPAAPKETVPEIDAATHYSRGNEHYKRYEFDQAINEYSEAVKKDPSMADAYIARGNAQSGKFNFENAKGDYSKGAELNAEYDHYARGYSYYLQQDYKSAVTEFSESISLEKNLFAAYNDRGLSYANMGNQDKAIADFTDAIGINSNSAFPYNNRGNAYLSKKNYDKAVEDYSKAVELYPKLVFPYTGRGVANYRLKEYDNAIADYTKAIEFTPNDAVLYSLRANAYMGKGENDKAENDRATAEKLKN